MDKKISFVSQAHLIHSFIPLFIGLIGHAQILSMFDELYFLAKFVLNSGFSIFLLAYASSILSFFVVGACHYKVIDWNDGINQNKWIAFSLKALIFCVVLEFIFIWALLEGM